MAILNADVAVSIGMSQVYMEDIHSGVTKLVIRYDEEYENLDG